MTLLELLERHVSPLQRKVRGAVLAELAAELAGRDVTHGGSEQLATYVLRMKHVAEDKLAACAAVEQRWDAFTKRYFRRGDERSRRQAIADYLTETVADDARRRADLAAMDRFLDYDALHERFLIERHHLLVVVEVALAFIASAGVAALEAAARNRRDALARELFDAGKLASFLHDLLETKARWQIRRAALDGLAAFAAEAREREREALAKLRHAHLGVAVRIATDPEDHAWVQGSAIRLVLRLQPELGFDLVAKRLLDPAAVERDFLVRRQCVDLLAGDEHARDPRALAVLRRALARRDPSEHVRQGLAEAFARLGCVDELSALAGLGDALEPSPRVRAVAVRAACRSQLEPAAVIGIVAGVLERDANSLVLAIACEDVLPLVDGDTLAGAHVAQLLAALLAVAAHPRHAPGVQETAAAAAERVHRAGTVAERAWRDYLATAIRDIAPGEAWSIRLSRLRELPELPSDPTFLGRILAELSRRDFPLAATRVGGRLVVWRGDRYRRRLWRVLHELRTPRPNKRQAHRHTVARQMRGHLRAPPGLLDEVTPTVIPGERVLVAEEGGWGRHVPTIDDLLDLPIWSGDAVRVYSSFGVTTIRPPRSWLARVRNRFALSVRYEALAALRLASLAGDESHARQRFADELRERYDIAITFERYDYAHARALAPGRLHQIFAPVVEEPIDQIIEQAS